MENEICSKTAMARVKTGSIFIFSVVDSDVTYNTNKFVLHVLHQLFCSFYTYSHRSLNQTKSITVTVLCGIMLCSVTLCSTTIVLCSITLSSTTVHVVTGD